MHILWKFSLHAGRARKNQSRLKKRLVFLRNILLSEYQRNILLGDKLKAELLSKECQGFNFIINDLNMMSQANDESVKKAVEHKNKLIEYDRNRWVISTYLVEEIY